MFRKKKKQEEVLPEVTEELAEQTESIEPSSPITERDNPASFFDLSEDVEDEVDELEPEKKKKKTRKEKKRKKQEVIEEPTIEDEEVITVLVGAEPWLWANTEEYELQKEKEEKKAKKRKKNKKEEAIDEVSEEPTEKKELSTFFEDSKEKNKKLKKEEKKTGPKEKKGKSRRKNKKDQLQEDIKNQKVFRYNGKKYTKVEDFITYLNEHYLDIETIAEEVLEDENFFGWINKNSGVFAKSLKEFKEIQAKIENKS